MAGLFQLSLDRLWRECSICLWTDHGRHILAFLIKTIPWEIIAGMFQLSCADYGGPVPALSGQTMAGYGPAVSGQTMTCMF